MVFNDIKIAYDQVTRELIWRCLEVNGVLGRYTRIVRDMYEGAKLVFIL